MVSHMFVCTSIDLCMTVCVEDTCMCVGVCVCIYIYIYIVIFCVNMQKFFSHPFQHKASI